MVHLMTSHNDAKERSAVLPGITVDIVTKANQRSKKLVRGIVKEVLTNTSFHPHGIKVRLQDGHVGRVQNIIRAGKGQQELS
jgi:uncharacterized repeat protein (TIGR03833 family)